MLSQVITENTMDKAFTNLRFICKVVDIDHSSWDKNRLSKQVPNRLILNMLRLTYLTANLRNEKHLWEDKKKMERQRYLSVNDNDLHLLQS